MYLILIQWNMSETGSLNILTCLGLCGKTRGPESAYKTEKKQSSAAVIVMKKIQVIWLTYA